MATGFLARGRKQSQGLSGSLRVSPGQLFDGPGVARSGPESRLPRHRFEVGDGEGALTFESTLRWRVRA